MDYIIPGSIHLFFSSKNLHWWKICNIPDIYQAILTANETFPSTLFRSLFTVISFTIFHTIYKWCIKEFIPFLFMVIWELVTCLFELLFRLSNLISSSLSSQVVFVLSSLLLFLGPSIILYHMKWVRVTIFIPVLYCKFRNVSLKILIFLICRSLFFEQASPSYPNSYVWLLIT